MRHSHAGYFLVGVALVLLVASAAFAQTSEPVQIAANTVTPVVPKSNTDAITSTGALQARIDAQQKQINELTSLVQKLQARLEPIASTQPLLPGDRIFATIGSAAPEPGPAAPPVKDVYSTPRELLPDLGHIGAELGFFVGGSTNPYKADKGFASGGYIDLPWKRVPGGKLSYEIFIGLQRAVTTTQTTSGVNVLVNTALNSYLGNTAANDTTIPGFLTGPLPITSTVEERSKLLTVAPFELKYTITRLGRFRPYVVGGLGTYVWIGSDSNTKTFDAVASLKAAGLDDATSASLGGTLNAILRGSQIGGLAPTAPELAARGVPHGQGNLMFGAQIGGGAEFRITPRLSIGFDYRANKVEGKNASFSTFAFKQGLHW